MIPLLSLAIIINPISNKMAWKITRFWKKTALALFGVKVKTEYKEAPSQLDKGGIIVGLNQQSLLDPTAGYSAWNYHVRSIWNIEYALIPFLGWTSFILGWVIIRQNPKQSKAQLNKASKHAKNGGLVFLSIEGQRSIDGNLCPYKKGPVVLAIQSQATIHPLYILGSRECLPPGGWKIRPGEITLHFLPPIQTRGLTYQDRNILLKKVRAIGEREHELWRQKKN